MKNLIQVISELDKCLQRQKELQGAVNHLRQLIPEENNRLQIEAQQEENEIKKAYHDGWVFAENKTKGVYLEDKYFNDNYGRLEKR